MIKKIINYIKNLLVIKEDDEFLLQRIDYIKNFKKE